MGTAGKLAYNSKMPRTSFVNYWSIGYIGGCPTNFAIFNTTHCFCDPASTLTFDPIYSNHTCRELCYHSFFFNYEISQCQSCKLVHSFICDSCNKTTCFNCTNGMQYYLKGITPMCVNCSSYGPLCNFCSDTQC